MHQQPGYSQPPPGYMPQQNYMPPPYAAATQFDTQDTGYVKSTLEKIDKQIKSANSVVIFIAVLNVLIGTLLTFLPDAFSGEGAIFDSSGGLFYIIFGLLYLGLSLGVAKRNRVCLLITALVFVVDAIFLLVNSNGSGIGTYIMRAILIFGLFSGVKYSFSYHSLLKKHSNTSNSEVSELIRVNKPKVKLWQIILCAIIGCVGIGIAVYGFAGGVYFEGRNFDDWIEYSSGAVTVRMPSSRIDEDTELITDLPGVTYHFAQSDGYVGSVFLITYKDMLGYMGFSASEAQELESVLLEDLVSEVDGRITNRSSGQIAEQVRYSEVSAIVDGLPSVIRCFSRGSDVYITGIIINRQDNEDFIDKFLDSIKVR